MGLGSLSTTAEIGRFFCSNVALGLISLTVFTIHRNLKISQAIFSLEALPGPPLTKVIFQCFKIYSSDSINGILERKVYVKVRIISANEIRAIVFSGKHCTSRLYFLCIQYSQGLVAFSFFGLPGFYTIPWMILVHFARKF